MSKEDLKGTTEGIDKKEDIEQSEEEKTIVGITQEIESSSTRLKHVIGEAESTGAFIQQMQVVVEGGRLNETASFLLKKIFELEYELKKKERTSKSKNTRIKNLTDQIKDLHTTINDLQNTINIGNEGEEDSIIEESEETETQEESEEPVIPPPEPDLEENATEPEESAEELREAGWRIVEDDEIFEPGEEFRIDINSGKKWVKVKGDTVVDPEEPQVPSPDLELDTKGREGETLDTEKLAPEESEETGTPEEIKDLGYLDIDPKLIFEKFNEEELGNLKELMQNGNKEGVKALYKSKIQEIIKENEEYQNKISEEQLDKAAEDINRAIEQKVELEAQKEIAKGFKKYGKIVGNILKNGLIVAGTATLIGALGITGVGGIVALAGGVSFTRMLTKKFSERSRKKKTAKNKEEFEIKLEEEKKEVIDKIFGDSDKLGKELSGHIANTLRQETSGQSISRLREYEESVGVGIPERFEKALEDVTLEFYTRAYTKVKAENPDKSKEELEKMAMTIALTLAQHERNEFEAKKRLDNIRKYKPGLYKVIEKYNLLSAGKVAEEVEIAEEDESIIAKYKHELISLGIGTAVGVAIRTVGPMRIVMGAVSGGSLGYMVGEHLEKKEYEKISREVTEMINQAEAKIEDIEFPDEKLNELRESSIIVRSRLEEGLLDGDSVLRSRAENFLHHVQKLEIKNQETLEGLFNQISENTDRKEEQIEEDFNKIEKDTRKRKIISTTVGATLGAAAAWLMMDTKDEEVKPEPESEPEPVVVDTPEPVVVDTPEPELDPSLTPVMRVDDATEDYYVEVTKGDSVWEISENFLKTRLGEDEWGSLDESQQTHLIDAVKDNVANSEEGLESFGITSGNIDQLNVGDKINLNKIFNNPEFLEKIQDQASNLTQEQLDNIKLNNEAIAEAASSGVKITSENVDDIIKNTRTYGAEFLDEKGNVHEWTYNNNPVDRLEEGSFVELTESGSETLTQEQLSEVTNHTGETATTLLAVEHKSTLENSLNTYLEVGNEAKYTNEIYKTAKELGEVDKVFENVLTSENSDKIESFISDYIDDQGFSENKAGIFLASMKSGEGELTGVFTKQATIGGLDEMIKSFEDVTHTSFESVKEINTNELHSIKIGDEYALIQKEHTGGFFGLFKKEQYLVDTTGDGNINTILKGDEALENVFKTKTLDIKTTTVEPESVVPDTTTATPDTTTVEPESVVADTTETAVELPEGSLVATDGTLLEFTDKYTDIDKENILKYFNRRTEELNAFPEALSKWEEQYGDKPEFANLKEEVDEYVNSSKEDLNKLVNTLDNEYNEKFNASISNLGEISPEESADDQINIISSKINFLTEAERIERMESSFEDAFK